MPSCKHIYSRLRALSGWRRAVLLLTATVLLMAVLLSSLVLTVSGVMVAITEDRIHSSEISSHPDLGGYDCILVLGAGVREDGTPSPMLADRVTVACELYGAGGVPLLMSGDHTGDYNEVGVMKELAMESGIPGEDIFLDHKGYSTYESLWRAKTVFGVKRIVIVSQGYHLHRALYIARELGMDAIGVASDLRPYRGQTRYEWRETLARFKDFFVAASKFSRDAFPTDSPIDLTGDGNLT